MTVQHFRQYERTCSLLAGWGQIPRQLACVQCSYGAEKERHPFDNRRQGQVHLGM